MMTSLKSKYGCVVYILYLGFPQALALISKTCYVQTMQLNRLQNRNLFTFHQFKKMDSNTTFINLPRWKKPLLKPRGIDSVKPIISGVKNVNLENQTPKPAEMRTLSLEVRNLALTNVVMAVKPSILESKTVENFKNHDYFEPEIKDFKYRINRWFSLNWFILASSLALGSSVILVLYFLFK